MINYYSASTNAFYTSEINGDNIPEDSVEITEECKASLLAQQSGEKVICSDENGYPIIKDAVLSEENLIFIETQWRNQELVCADIELNKVQDADPKAVGTVAQWRDYRKMLRAYPESEGFPSGTRPVSPK